MKRVVLISLLTLVAQWPVTAVALIVGIVDGGTRAQIVYQPGHRQDDLLVLVARQPILIPERRTELIGPYSSIAWEEVTVSFTEGFAAVAAGPLGQIITSAPGA